MIEVRNDDVILKSSTGSDSFKRFKGVHETICRVPSRLLHVPTILTEEIEEFPEAVDYIKFETKYKRMRPELHGLRHIDYGKLPYGEVMHQLELASDWFIDNLGYLPSKWYTPWGASQEHLHRAARDLGMQAIDTTSCIKLKGRNGVKQLLSEGKPTSWFDGKEVIMHWWSGIDCERISELVEVLLSEARTTD